MLHTHLLRLLIVFGVLAVAGVLAAERERRAAVARRAPKP
jgi:hypothetical protein